MNIRRALLASWVPCALVTACGSSTSSEISDASSTADANTPGTELDAGVSPRDGSTGTDGSSSVDANAPDAGFQTGTTGKLAASFENTCFVTALGGVKCWGGNTYGALGDGTKIDRNVPTDVQGLSSGVAKVFAQGRHTCALTTTGGLKCWGENNYGQIGDGSAANDRLAPVDVVGLSSGVTDVGVGGQYTCAIHQGNVKCWGLDNSGQLGLGSAARFADHFTPELVPGTTGATHIYTSDYFACAVLPGGTKCWGNDNGNFRLTGNQKFQSYDPVSTPDFATLQHFWGSLGSPICGTSPTEQKCWGLNGYGNAGGGQADANLTPRAVTVLGSQGLQFAPADDATCALLGDGTVKCFGNDTFNVFGGGLKPQGGAVALPGKAITVVAGHAHTCVLLQNSDVYCWGKNTHGEMGDGTNVLVREVPTRVPGL